MAFDSKAFVQFLIDNGVVGFFEKPVTLKSGRQSHFYCNWRNVAADTFLIDRLADFLIAFAQDEGFSFDAFYGVPEGATKLGVIATYKWARQQPGFAPGSHPLPMGRACPKQHGAPQDRFFVGAPRGRILVVEDVTTTGGSLLNALDGLAQLDDVQIVAAVGLTNRMEKRDDGRSVAEAIEAKGVAYVSLSDATQFLPQVFAALKPGEEIARAIEAEFSEYGVKPLKLL